MAARLRVLKAVAGRKVGGKFVRSAKNIAAGFYDDEGIFHPIRKSFDYDPRRGGDPQRKGKRPKAKKKPARKRVKGATKKKARAKKKRSR